MERENDLAYAQDSCACHGSICTLTASARVCLCACASACARACVCETNQGRDSLLRQPGCQP
eukprot:3447920-Alexandrium_andersonii.AAC.1